jgi:hypothetical protein
MEAVTSEHRLRSSSSAAGVFLSGAGRQERDRLSRRIHEACEFILIAAAEDVHGELGIDLDAQDEEASSADIFEQLKIVHPDLLQHAANAIGNRCGSAHKANSRDEQG